MHLMYLALMASKFMCNSRLTQINIIISLSISFSFSVMYFLKHLSVSNGQGQCSHNLWLNSSRDNKENIQYFPHYNSTVLHKIETRIPTPVQNILIQIFHEK